MTTRQLTTIEIFEEKLCFSAAHFTIFSPTHRERLHGHNYRVAASVTAEVTDLGITVNYDIYVDKILELCKQFDLHLLLPRHSPVLEISEVGANYQVIFNGEVMQFLKSDTLIVNVRNITLEEMSRWFLEQILQDSNVCSFPIKELVVKVSNGGGHWGSTTWSA